jgi:hypothetical protein
MSGTAEPPRLLTPAQAAERLGLSTSTLAKYRCLKSTGPIFIRLGSAIRYPEDLLADFIARQPRRTSTSDTGDQAA